MAKDSLTSALFELKERERRTRTRNGRRNRPNAATRPRRGRPKAFDSFYVFSITLLLFTLALQFVAIWLYA